MKRNYSYANRTFLIILFLLYKMPVNGQLFLVNEFRYLANDISARENEVVGNDNLPCSLLKVRVGLSNASFSSEKEIRKVEKHQGEYWLWVDQGTTDLKISADGFNPLDYKIPVHVEQSNVYILVISVIFPERIVYRDTMPSYVSFATDPPGGRLYINNTYYGLTPIKINIPYKTFSYSIKKPAYETINGIDTIFSAIQGETYTFSYYPKKRRTYVLLMTGGSEFGPFGGFMLGRLGSTGYYGSVLLGGIYSNLTYEYERDVIESKIPLEINLGLTQQMFNHAFLSLGAGYVSSYYWEEDVYTTLTRFNGFSVSGGIIFRIRKLFLLNLKYSALNIHDNSRMIPFRPVSSLTTIGFGINIY